MSLSASMKLTVSASLSRALDLVTAQSPMVKSALLAFSDGAGANQADRVFHDTRTIAASGNEDLDLAGSLTDVYGQTITFARIKGVIIIASSGNTNNVNVSRPASNGVPLFLAASDGLAVKPGGFFAWGSPDASGVAVTAGTGDLLNIANSGGTTGVTYDVIIIGAAS